MSPLIDNRIRLAGQPGVHALIVGVSEYVNLPTDPDDRLPRHYGLGRLNSAALAARRFFEWLVAADVSGRLEQPLATCRLLLSPSPGEVAVHPPVQQADARASVSAFLSHATEWRKDAASHRDNITFFYFAGHGLQRKPGEVTLLLDEFGTDVGGALVHSVDINNVYYGMAPSRTFANIARTQYYFVDACRTLPDNTDDLDELHPTQVFSSRLSKTDDRAAPILFATPPGDETTGIRRIGSVFGEALIECLDGDAGDYPEVNGQEQWLVGLQRLIEVMGLKSEDQRDWSMTTAGQAASRIVCYLKARPNADLVFEMIPEAEAATLQIRIREAREGLQDETYRPPLENPHRIKVPAGYYIASAGLDPPDPLRTVDLPGAGEPRKVLPPRVTRTITVRR